MVDSKSMNPFLTLVIPTLTPSKTIETLLESIASQRCSWPVEVLVIGNPTPLQIRHKSHWPKFQNLTSESKGVNRARQMGVQAARSRWLYFLDDDCYLLRSDHLDRLCQRLQDTSENTLLGGLYEHSNDSSKFSKAYHRLQTIWVLEGRNSQYGFVNLLGGNLVIARSAFETFSFDESIEFGGSETELIHRMLRQGFRGVLLNELAVGHSHSLSKNELIQKAARQGYGFERLMSQRILIPRTVRSLLSHESPLELESELSLYDLAFKCGQYLYFQSPDVYPQYKLQEAWRIVKKQDAEVKKAARRGAMARTLDLIANLNFSRN
jgi:glycosyltransferase involved in cell wall biosynthesis